MIGHAGQGGVNKALIHGIPMVLVPWDRDQPGVAYRAEQLGIAVAVPRDKLSPEALNEAISMLLSDPEYFTRAAEIARAMQKIDSVGFACGLIENAARTRA